MLCCREKSIGLKEIQQNDKSTQVFERKLWIRGLVVTVTMGKGVLRECNYKNHRIFSLRCISSNLVLVSVKLRSSCSKISQGARKIIQKAEKQLLKTESDVSITQ